ncbi:hypothetical protein M3Y99_00365000 [Aphelenchoides fujianensis]|nr:hypothetical protein M3Y99_00365000 [Aphelenchoides fujianensis]
MLSELLSRLGRKLRHRKGSYSLASGPPTSEIFDPHAKCTAWMEGVTIEKRLPLRSTRSSRSASSEGSGVDTSGPKESPAELWLRTFKRHFLSKTRAFALRNVENPADAHELHVQLESARKTLDQMLAFYGSNGASSREENELIDSVFRPLYDFLLEASRQVCTSDGRPSIVPLTIFPFLLCCRARRPPRRMSSSKTADEQKPAAPKIQIDPAPDSHGRFQVTFCDQEYIVDVDSRRNNRARPFTLYRRQESVPGKVLSEEERARSDAALDAIKK